MQFPKLRNNIAVSFKTLEMKKVHVLSGDKTESVKEVLSKIPISISYKAACTPMDKVEYIKELSGQGSKVIIVGDGLNDAGALNWAYLGVSVMNENFSFSPGSDALLEGNQMYRIPQFLKLARFGQKTIKIVFAYSFIYNFIGLAYAVTGHLKPLVAAILMPISSLSIIFLSFFALKVYEIKFGKLKNVNILQSS
ncbi:MAG: HAD-IC family P-type ATPase [Saprospiraceae bacterium]|nr:HAD-IC family P-type ATPase [Saprospiraceae bacterium]